MWTAKHWRLFFILCSALFLVLIFRESVLPEKANLPALEAAQEQEIEEIVKVEASYYRDGKLLLNQAPKEKLEELPGVGPVLADQIIQYRSRYGAFKSVDQLRNVKGIGPKKLEAIRSKVIVE